jgi:hypothetical protein
LKAARKEPGAARTVWSNDSRILTFSWSHIIDRKIDLEELCRQTFRNVQNLRQHFENLFPPGFTSSNFSDLTTSAFVDSDEASSIFEIPSNCHILDPLRTELYRSFQEQLTSGMITTQDIFDNSQKFLASFVCCSFVTTAVPPRSFQLADFRYATDGNSCRNFRLVDQLHGVFVNPKPSATSICHDLAASLTDESLWLIPPQMTWMLLLFLGVFRPVEISLAEDEFPKVSLKEMHFYVFSCPGRRSKSLVWSPENIDYCLKSGDGLKMEGYAHRLVYSAIIREHLGHLLKEIDQGTVLDFQLQHSPRTAIHHYAVERLQQITGIRYTVHEKQMVIAQALHALCYLVKPVTSAAAQARIPRSITSNIQSHEHYAFFSARHLILQKYQLASLSTMHVAVKSRHLCWTAPFLYRESVPESEMLGDDILIQLVLELHRGPGVSQGMPSDNSVIPLAASGSTLVKSSLEFVVIILSPHDSDHRCYFRVVHREACTTFWSYHTAEPMLG